MDPYMIKVNIEKFEKDRLWTCNLLGDYYVKVGQTFWTKKNKNANQWLDRCKKLFRLTSPRLLAEEGPGSEHCCDDETIKSPRQCNA